MLAKPRLIITVSLLLISSMPRRAIANDGGEATAGITTPETSSLPSAPTDDVSTTPDQSLATQLLASIGETRNCAAVPCAKKQIADAHELFLAAASLVDGECPPDSHRPAPFVPDGQCCLLTPGCECRSAACQPPHCNATSEDYGDDVVLVVDRRGNGRPGSCCDTFRCVKKKELAASEEARQTTGQITSCALASGAIYREGENWLESPCQTCICSGGVALCKRMECPTLSEHCLWADTPEGECCPQCMGCDRDHAVGVNWMMDDCTNCTCLDDYKLHCQKELCKTDCDNPRRVDGQCCPVCDEPLILEEPLGCPSLELCPLQCDLGYRRNQWGCFECVCVNEPPLLNGTGSGVDDPQECPPLTEDACPKRCAHGYERDSTDCSLCRCAVCPRMDQCYKQCLYGFETNANGCSLCKCRASGWIDARFKVVTTGTAQRVENATDSGDCTTRRVVGAGELTRVTVAIQRDHGEWWTDGHCRQCFCERGREFCSLVACAARPNWCPEESWGRHSGNECCPTCSAPIVDLRDSVGGEEEDEFIVERSDLAVCHSPGTGRLYVDGETWQLTDCVACTCRMGHVLCSSQRCPPVACDDPIEEGCCAKCHIEEEQRDTNSSIRHIDSAKHCMDEEGSTSHKVGDEWRRDECTSCRCANNGTVDCYTPRCSQTNCAVDAGDRPLVVKELCCPMCSSRLSPSNTAVSAAPCHYGPDGHFYTAGEQFRDGPCRNCSCRSGGIVECAEVKCDECAKAERECCATCEKGPEPTLQNNYQHFEVGEEVIVVSGMGEEDHDGGGGNAPDSLHFGGAQLSNSLLYALSLMVSVVLVATCAGAALCACRYYTKRNEGKKAGGGRQGGRVIGPSLVQVSISAKHPSPLNIRHSPLPSPTSSYLDPTEPDVGASLLRGSSCGREQEVGEKFENRGQL